jgi:hypothetical protein
MNSLDCAHMRRQRARYTYPPRRGPCVSEVWPVINTGLSVTMGGYLIDLHRDETEHVAIVRVGALAGDHGVGVTLAELKAAADILAARAQRALGLHWLVVQWDMPAEGGGIGQSQAG